MKNKTWYEWQKKYRPELHEQYNYTVSNMYPDKQREKELQQTMRKNRKLCGLPNSWTRSAIMADMKNNWRLK